jgi:dTDP-4-dehydrorhamnose reductase
MKKFLVTGGEGRFANVLKKITKKNQFIFRNKAQLNILSENSIKRNFTKFKPDCIIHLAGLSRPMSIHDENISKSIDLNIIGTCNLVKACDFYKVKLIFFSTSYVYPGKKGNYKESDPILPWNNYGWSKIGAEAAVHMLKNSLIIRACMTEKPFLHKSAFSNVKSNFIFHEDIAKMFMKVINKKGIINIGGKSQTIYKFAKKYNKDVRKRVSKGEFPKKMDMNLNKFKNYTK